MSDSPTGDTTADHREAAGEQRADCAVLTVSDSRTHHNDGGGPIIVRRLENAGHHLIARGLVPDEAERIESSLRSWLEDSPDLVITTGGTGISSRDTTIEVVEGLLDKRLDAFEKL